MRKKEEKDPASSKRHREEIIGGAERQWDAIQPGDMTLRWWRLGGEGTGPMWSHVSDMLGDDPTTTPPIVPM
ncbi:hypothetical protein Nepgr_013134 [Nepenthes gracilis]|uniref:Uncharacterized protein n=1 Tax=Nepenthes gracilis TaxID=150966 RepID=A0AAD3XNQ3_NEPGR|nr:hypothetical protein Nepgr_013134 [Nepenthes gracilis]